MRVLAGSQLQSAEPEFAAEGGPAEAGDSPAQGALQSPKFRLSIEKKIENIWLESEQLGWSYSDFVFHLMEILIVLNYRSLMPKLNQASLKDTGSA
jgi:hypothetical protein